MNAGTVVIGYQRVSSEEQGASGAGLDAQTAAIQAECAHRGWQLLRIEEDVYTGRTTDRPGLARALLACELGEAEGIVVSKLDRLTRSVVDLASLVERAQERNFNLVAIDFGLDLHSANGQLVANVLVSVGQWQTEVISERTRSALAVRKAQGVRLGGRPVDDDLRDRIVALHEEGMSINEIARHLNHEGVEPQRGGARWYASTVRAILVRASREEES